MSIYEIFIISYFVLFYFSLPQNSILLTLPPFNILSFPFLIETNPHPWVDCPTCPTTWSSSLLTPAPPLVQVSNLPNLIIIIQSLPFQTSVPDLSQLIKPSLKLAPQALLILYSTSPILILPTDYTLSS